MKLLIDDDITYSTTFYPGTPAEELDELSDYFHFLKDTLEDLGVTYLIDCQESGVSLTIYTQKVVLDDLAMNTFFSEILDEFFEFKLGYANLGGRGCEVAFRLVEVVPRA